MIQNNIETRHFTDIKSVIDVILIAGKERKNIDIQEDIDESLPSRYYLDKYLINNYFLYNYF